MKYMNELIHKCREATGKPLTIEEMRMIADINRILMNLQLMTRLLKNK